MNTTKSLAICSIISFLSVFTLQGKETVATLKQQANNSPIAALDLFNLFKKDREKAQKLYNGKTIEVKGIIIYSGPSKGYRFPSVNLSDKAGGAFRVMCVLPFHHYLKLRGLADGQEVTISGKYYGAIDDGVVVIKQSQILAK